MKETLQDKHRFSFSLLKISKNDIIEKQVLPAALVTLLCYVSWCYAYNSAGLERSSWSEEQGTFLYGFYSFFFADPFFSRKDF
jgi:hypothetical protein